MRSEKVIRIQNTVAERTGAILLPGVRQLRGHVGDDAFKQGGPRGYWQERLDKALAQSPQKPQSIAIYLAHLKKTDEAYVWLNKALQEDKLQGLWVDPCWDHSDERFKAIAKNAGAS